MRVGGMVGERERRRSQSLEVLGLRAARPRRRLPLLSRIVWRHIRGVDAGLNKIEGRDPLRHRRSRASPL